MKSITKLWSLLLVAFIVAACQPSEKSETAESEESLASETAEVAEESTKSSNFINPNLATAEDLTTAGLSVELIDQITENRPFLTMTDLDAVISTTMDSTQRANLYANFFVPFNLNTTPEDEFKLIPGVGNRMAHEFEEYRPYVSIAQFRKEIGKYVDETEVARFENYVFVPVELNTASKEEILAIPGVGDRMLHEFEEYRPYASMDQFRKEIGKYVDEKELARLERFVYLKETE